MYWMFGFVVAIAVVAVLEVMYHRIDKMMEKKTAQKKELITHAVIEIECMSKRLLNNAMEAVPQIMEESMKVATKSMTDAFKS